MYGIFTYIYHKNSLNVGKYTIHGWYGLWSSKRKQLCESFVDVSNISLTSFGSSTGWSSRQAGWNPPWENVSGQLLEVQNIHIVPWSFLVPLIGGRWYISPQYIPLIYCLLGDYKSPTTYSGNQKQLLNRCANSIDLYKKYPVMSSQSAVLIIFKVMSWEGFLFLI